MHNSRPTVICVEVVYALPHAQRVIPLQIAADATIRQAVIESGILELYPEIELDSVALGIFGKRRSSSDVLQHGDRIEIYRVLRAEAKDARRLRARRTRAKG